MYDYRQGLWAYYLFCLLELVRGNGNYLINLPIQLVLITSFKINASSKVSHLLEFLY